MKISIITALKGENDSYLTCLLDYYQPLLRDNIELVIQDSSEKTSSLFFSPNRNISYEHYKDSSIYEAWNRAIIRAKGQIYLFLGSDDIPTPEYLHYLKNISLAKNEIIHSDASYTNKPFVFSDAKEIKRIMYSFNNKVSGIDFNCPPPFVAFSSKLFKEHKFNEEYKIISDGLFYFSIDHFYIQDKYEGTSVRMTHGGISNSKKGTRKRYIEFLRAVKNNHMKINYNLFFKIFVMHFPAYLASFLPEKIFKFLQSRS
jgi:hypothetical protein